MAYYKSPFRPFDPVIPSDGNPEPIRYLRDNFTGTGQDSRTNPPAQDQAQWQELNNVMPISQGTLSPRWGSQLFTSTSVDVPLVFQEDLLDWYLQPYPQRLTTHLKGNANSQYSWLDADGQKFWQIKGSSGNPWDIRLYDSQYLYWWITENGTQNAFTNPQAYKRYNTVHNYPLPQAVPMAPRFFTLGSTITIDTPGPNPIIKTLDCGADNQAPTDIKDIRGVTQGPFLLDFGGDVGQQQCIIINYFYSGTAGVYTNRERYYMVKGFGVVQWDHATFANGVYTVVQTSTFNTVLAGGAPTPNFPCYPQPWWIGGAPGAGGNVATPSFALPTGLSATSATGTYVAHMYSYQHDTDGLRTIVATDAGPSGLGGQSFKEDGTLYSTLPARNANTSPYRLISSRNYAYLYNGDTNQKWDGSQTGGFTNWGINSNAVSNSTTSKFAGTAAGTGWSNPTFAQGANNGTAATISPAAAGSTNILTLTNFALSSSGTIKGISATIWAGATSSPVPPKTFRPTTSSGVIVSPSNAWDGNLSTYALISAAPGAAFQTVSNTGIIKGIPASGSPTPATLKLTVKASGDNQADIGATGSGSCAYSLDGGTTWLGLFSFSTNGSGGGTYTINLSPTQNLTLVQVRGVATAKNGSSISGALSSTDILIYEVSVTATYASGATSVTVYTQLVKAGVAYGAWHTKTITLGAITPFTLGSATDLWSGSFSSSDINASNFGINVWFATNGGATCSVDAVNLNVAMSGGGPVITSTSTSGAVTLVAGRTYYTVAKNSRTGHYSDLSQPSTSSGAITNKQVALTLPVYSDAQVDTKVLLATADGNDPSILYQVTELANATTTFNDNTPDTVLVLNQVLLTTDDLGNEIGITNNDPPPLGNLAIKHKGRLWMAQGQNLFFSKSVGELTLPNGFIAGKYEESWPPANYFDISIGAETVQGLLSDGDVLYIGTERHIRKLFGDNPDNFQQPEIVHQEVGLLNQDVWVPIFLEGAPSGAMWLTPDNRVIGSDFNAYADIGHPIQDVLNTINSAVASSVAHAMFASQGEFDLYILAIPTGTNVVCDTHCVFDLRSKQWFIWQPTDPSTAMLYNVTASGAPQWLFATAFQTSTNNLGIFQYTSTSNTDRAAVAGANPIQFPVSATTSWLHFGTPTQRKLLNELDIVGDPEMLVSVSSASTQPEFQAPKILVLDAPLFLDPLKKYKLRLAGVDVPGRYYQITFESSGTNDDFLDSFAVHAIPEVAL